jgi:hypothetical protein
MHVSLTPTTIFSHQDGTTISKGGVFTMFSKATLTLTIAVALVLGALADPKVIVETRGYTTTPSYPGPDAPMRSWNEYGKRWE